MATSSSETLSPIKATLSLPATGSRKLFTSSSERRCSSPVKHTLVFSTAWRTRPLSPCHLWFISTWGTGRLWPSGAELRFSGLWTGHCLSVTWRRPLAPSSDHHPATPTSCVGSRGCVREGQIIDTYMLSNIQFANKKLSVNRPHACGPSQHLEVHLKKGTQSGCTDIWFCTLLATFILHCFAFSYGLKIKKISLWRTPLSRVSIQSRFYPQGGRRQQRAGWATSGQCRRILSLYSIQQWVNIKILLPLWHKCKWCDLGLVKLVQLTKSSTWTQYVVTVNPARNIWFQ